MCNTHRVILPHGPFKASLFWDQKELTENNLMLSSRQLQIKALQKFGALEWANRMGEWKDVPLYKVPIFTLTFDFARQHIDGQQDALCKKGKPS